VPLVKLSQKKTNEFHLVPDIVSLVNILSGTRGQDATRQLLQAVVVTILSVMEPQRILVSFHPSHGREFIFMQRRGGRGSIKFKRHFDIINGRMNKTRFIIKYAHHDRWISLQDHRGPVLERERQLEERDNERTGTNPTNMRVFDQRRNSSLQMKKSVTCHGHCKFEH
jgi:hypothetical protein